MEGNEISVHEVRVYEVLRTAASWLSSKDIALWAKVAPRTARHHALRLVRLGVVDRAEVFPAHRYRLSDFADKRNRGYVDRLHRAAEVLEIETVSAKAVTR
jgi:DNA-binding CsgD family transcriptional regulator